MSVSYTHLGGMLPMREEAAAEVMKSCQIYRLYGDDTEGLVLDTKEIREHAAKGGIFGVEKADWVAALEKQNPLKAAEMSLEDDYGMIDGIINNGPKEDKVSEKGGKASIMDRLKSAKTAQQTDKPSPHKAVSYTHLDVYKRQALHRRLPSVGYGDCGKR